MQITNSDHNVEINSLEDINRFLRELSVGANESLIAALNAQLQVLMYVESPELYDSTFDLLFENLRKSLSYASSAQEKNMIKEEARIMIQNYIFFIDVKLRMQVDLDKKKGEELAEQSIDLLCESVINISTIVATKNTKGQAEHLKEFFSQMKKYMHGVGKKEKGRSFSLGRMLRSLFENTDEKNRIKRQEFLSTINKLIYKLNKRSHLIGESYIIAGLVERYSGQIIRDDLAPMWKKINQIKNSAEDQSREYGKYCIIFLISSIIIRAIYYQFTSDENAWFVKHLLWGIGITIGLVATPYIIASIKTMQIKKYIKKRNAALRRYYKGVANKFER